MSSPGFASSRLAEAIVGIVIVLALACFSTAADKTQVKPLPKPISSASNFVVQSSTTNAGVFKPSTLISDTNATNGLRFFPELKAPADIGASKQETRGEIVTQNSSDSLARRLERYERMNGTRVFEFYDRGGRGSDFFKRSSVSPQYRWDTFQSGKPPPRGFRDGITSGVFD